ncbi:MAG TPA: hypothetical protein VF785_22880 [Gemmatimonadaceae bacterium]
MVGRSVAAQEEAPGRLDRGRFTAVYFPSDRTLAQSLLDYAVRTDTFPGLPRPQQHVVLAIAPNGRRFREWIGPGAPEWGAAITFPESRRTVMQGRFAGAEAGDPREVYRHELAHLALHEFLGDAPPRWFDEGYASYAAHEWRREDALAANVALALKGTPTFDELDAEFNAGSTTAQNAYALAYRALVDLAALDTTAGLARFLRAWREAGSMDRAFRATYGITLVEFEQRWQQRTRRRYGGLALIGDFAIGGLVLLVVVFPLYVARRQRDRQRLAALLAADEAAERAARRSAIEALLRGDDESDLRGGTPEIPPS